VRGEARWTECDAIGCRSARAERKPARRVRFGSDFFRKLGRTLPYSDADFGMPNNDKFCSSAKLRYEASPRRESFNARSQQLI
jgi:hypothetical protein